MLAAWSSAAARPRRSRDLREVGPRRRGDRSRHRLRADRRARSRGRPIVDLPIEPLTEGAALRPPRVARRPTPSKPRAHCRARRRRRISARCLLRRVGLAQRRVEGVDLPPVRSHGAPRHGATTRAQTPPWCASSTGAADPAHAKGVALTTDCNPPLLLPRRLRGRAPGRRRGLPQPLHRWRRAARRSPTA